MGVTTAAVSLTTLGAEVPNLMVSVAVTVGLPAVKGLGMLPVAVTGSVAQAFAAEVDPARRTHTPPAKGTNLVSVWGSCSSYPVALATAVSPSWMCPHAQLDHTERAEPGSNEVPGVSSWSSLLCRIKGCAE